MKQSIKKIFSALILAVTISASVALANNVVYLQDVRTKQIPGNQVQIALSFSAMPALPTAFSMDDPSQMIFDFANTANSLAKAAGKLKLAAGMIKEINFVESEDKVRMIARVVKVVPFQTEREGNNIIITFSGDQEGFGTNQQATAVQDLIGINDQGSTGNKQATAESCSITTTNGCLDSACDDEPVTPSIEAANTYDIKAIDFRRGEEGEGRLIIDLATESAPIDFSENDNEMTLEYKGATIADKLLRRFDVSDFGTPIKRVVVLRENNTVRFKIQAVGDYDKVAYQVDNKYVVEVKPMTAQAKDAAKMQKFKFTGERISLNFQDIEVRAVLQLLADFTGLNIIASDSVAGNVTLRLDNVPWDQALDFILKSKGLGKRTSGNIILIAPNEEIATREQVELESIKQAETLAQLESKYIQINYAKASNIEKMLHTDGNSVLSERGVVSVDARTNLLLVKDTKDNINEIEKLVEKLDVPIRQVLIEAQVVQTTDNFLDVFGVNFSGPAVSQVGKYNVGISGDVNAAHRIAKADANNNNSYQADTGSTGSTTVATSGTNANTQTTSSTAANFVNDNVPYFNMQQGDAVGKLGLAIAKLPGGTLLDLELRASELEDKSKVLARPKLMTLDQQTASIETGTEIPYGTTAQQGSTPTITFKKAVLRLEVTPQITPNNKVLLALAISQDKPGASYNGNTGIDTTSLKTNILIDNGETVVLGGIFQVNHSKKINRIPFFSDIPFIGRFFRDLYDSNNRQEILLFVTPKVIQAPTFTKQ